MLLSECPSKKEVARILTQASESGSVCPLCGHGPQQQYRELLQDRSLPLWPVAAALPRTKGEAENKSLRHKTFSDTVQTGNEAERTGAQTADFHSPKDLASNPRSFFFYLQLHGLWVVTVSFLISPHVAWGREVYL